MSGILKYFDILSSFKIKKLQNLTKDSTVFFLGLFCIFRITDKHKRQQGHIKHKHNRWRICFHLHNIKIRKTYYNSQHNHSHTATNNAQYFHSFLLIFHKQTMTNTKHITSKISITKFATAITKYFKLNLIIKISSRRTVYVLLITMFVNIPHKNSGHT